MEGAIGEIRRHREVIGRLTGQGKPEVVQCHGRLKAAGKVDAEYYGLAVLPQYREAKPKGSSAPLIPLPIGFSLAKAGATS